MFTASAVSKYVKRRFIQRIALKKTSSC